MATGRVLSAELSSAPPGRGHRAVGTACSCATVGLYGAEMVEAARFLVRSMLARTLDECARGAREAGVSSCGVVLLWG